MLFWKNLENEQITAIGVLKFYKTVLVSYEVVKLSPGPDDIYVSPSRLEIGLRTDSVEGEIRGPKDAERYFAL